MDLNFLMVLNFSDSETQNATVEFLSINNAKMSIKATFKNLINLVKGLTMQRIEKQRQLHKVIQS